MCVECCLVPAASFACLPIGWSDCQQRNVAKKKMALPGIFKGAMPAVFAIRVQSKQ